MSENILKILYVTKISLKYYCRIISVLTYYECITRSVLLLKYLRDMDIAKDIQRLSLERYSKSIYMYTSSYINISKGYTIPQIYIPCLCGISRRYYHFPARYLDEISQILLWLCGESHNPGKKVILRFSSQQLFAKAFLVTF